MKDKITNFGLLYFFIHFIIEIISFYVVTKYTNSFLFFTLALIYDFYAFVPQGLLGYLKDNGLKIDFSVLGSILSLISLILLYFRVYPIIVIIFIAIGNSLIHVEGAETTLRTSKGKMSSPALFVAGGSFGVITGKLMASNKVPIWILIIINLMIFIPIIICNKYNKYISYNNELKDFNYSNKMINYKTVIALAVLVIIIRSYMGYGIPTAWNKTTIQAILLFCLMGTGKALGGILIDHIGIRKTAILSTLGSIPFLIFGNKIMIISIIGVMLFSMTMAITLALIVSEIKKYPGIAFGFTTLGLFLGSLPIFFFRVESLLINCIIVIVLSITSFIILNRICRKEKY